MKIKLAIQKSIADIFHSICTEHNAFKHKINTTKFLNENVFVLSPKRPTYVSNNNNNNNNNNNEV
jgi:hypothetical protein